MMPSHFKFRECVFLLYLALPITLPNSLRLISIPLFLATGILAAITSYKNIGKTPLFVYFLSITTTTIFLLIGIDKAHHDAINWVTFVYIISPAIWLSYWSALLHTVHIEKLVRCLAAYSIIACLSVYLFLYLFLNHGPSAVDFFISEANVEFSEGKIGATMHVFGSIIFLTTAFLASPAVIKNKSVSRHLTALLLITALISGRTALFLAALIGIAINIINSNGKKRILYLIGGIAMLFGVAATLSISSAFSNDGEAIDAYKIISDTINKVSQGGGEERTKQLTSLLEGIYDSTLTGVGHGISASVVRNDISPWKYELLWVSTIFHTGAIGFLIYSIPVALVFLACLKLKKGRRFNEFDLFMASGLTSILISSNTNPYLQSFDFQWMLIMPCVYFYKRHKSLKAKHPND